MLLRLRQTWRRPAKFGSVLLSYLGIIAVATLSAYQVGAQSERAAVERQAAITAEAQRADAAIVRTGRLAVKSGCKFDNQRAVELRGILERSIENNKQLVKDGALEPETAARNIRIGRQAVKNISTRDCAAAAKIISADPKE